MTQSGFATSGFATIGTETTPAAVAALSGTAGGVGQNGIGYFSGSMN